MALWEGGIKNCIVTFGLAIPSKTKQVHYRNLRLDIIAKRDNIFCMHIITRKRLLDFIEAHPNCSSSLDSWYRIIKQSTIGNFADLRYIFPGADQVEGLTVFNIGGNKARLIVAIHYNAQRVYIRHVLTHSEYDKNKWKEG